MVPRVAGSNPVDRPISISLCRIFFLLKKLYSTAFTIISPRKLDLKLYSVVRIFYFYYSLSMSFFQEFKDFAMKGNVIDLAIGVIIGAAFGKIVSSLVGDILMPLLSLLTGGVNFSTLAFELVPVVIDPTGAVVTEAVVLRLGAFLQVVFDFVLISLSIFVAIKILAYFHKKKKVEKNPPRQEVLLAEIRDLLKKK